MLISYPSIIHSIPQNYLIYLYNLQDNKPTYMDVSPSVEITSISYHTPFVTHNSIILIFLVSQEYIHSFLHPKSTLFDVILSQSYA
jgi:hypothetical protein